MISVMGGFATRECGGEIPPHPVAGRNADFAAAGEVRQPDHLSFHLTAGTPLSGVGITRQTRADRAQ